MHTGLARNGDSNIAISRITLSGSDSKPVIVWLQIMF